MAATTTPPSSSPHAPVRPGQPVVVPAAAAAGPVDYAGTFDAYWSASDRLNTAEPTSISMLAHQVLVTCGPGRLLDVGCGRGGLVRELLARGVDAHGADVSRRVVEFAAARTPGRFAEASVLGLPHADATFDTVTAINCLEHLADADLSRALAEIARVARRNVFVTVATRPEIDGRAVGIARPREWWEQRLIEAGLRKHPAAPGILQYESLERQDGEVTLVMEKLPAEAAASHPLESLREQRGLHMDMLREAGRRSDAHVVRYALAAGFVRRGDTVVDAACGLGYGAAVIARMSAAAKIIGIDSDDAAVAYARANFGPTDARCEFCTGDAQDLSALADDSVDMVASFETLEHVPHPERLIAEALRVLRPGGRLVASVPNEWVDETGKDPNPHHLHVYTWEKLSRQIREAAGPGGTRLVIERAYAQTAGSGMKHPHEPRRMSGVAVDESGELRGPGAATPAEWWVVVAMKVNDGGEGTIRGATSILSRGQGAEYHPLSFAREYQNPWLGDIMVMIGHRMTDARALEGVAKKSLAQASPGSADEGAALCVLGYRLLEPPARPHSEVEDLLQALEAFDQRAGQDTASAHVLRWRISNRFVAGKLLLSLGRLEAARSMFLRCAELDPVPFSPLLASKTVEALFHAGVLAMNAGDAAAAGQAWQRGLTETRRALSGDWSQIWDDPSRPAPFALPEVASLADAASMCAQGLIGLDEWPDRPGRVWRAMHAGTRADLRSWIAHLERNAAAGAGAGPARPAGADEWLKSQVENWRGEADRRDTAIRELQQWSRQLADGKAWLESRLNQTQGRLMQVEESNKWLKGQVSNWQSETQKRDEAIATLKAWTAQLEAGKAWLQGQVDESEARVRELEQRTAAAEARAREAELEIGRRTIELGSQISQLKTARAEAEDQVRMAREHEAKLKMVNRQYKQILKALSSPMGLAKAVGRAIIGRPAKDWPKD